MSDPLSGPSVSRAVRFATTGGGGSAPPDIFPTDSGAGVYVYELQVNGTTVDTVNVSAYQIGQGLPFTVRKSSTATLNPGDVIKVVCTSQPDSIWNGCNYVSAGTSLNYLRIRVRGGGVLGPLFDPSATYSIASTFTYHSWNTTPEVTYWAGPFYGSPPTSPVTLNPGGGPSGITILDQSADFPTYPHATVTGQLWIGAFFSTPDYVAGTGLYAGVAPGTAYLLRNGSPVASYATPYVGEGGAVRWDLSWTGDVTAGDLFQVQQPAWPFGEGESTGFSINYSIQYHA